MRKGEPELDFISNGGLSTFIDVKFDIDGAFLTFRVEFEGVEFIMGEVLCEDGVGLFGEVGPGIYFETFGF